MIVGKQVISNGWDFVRASKWWIRYVN